MQLQFADTSKYSLLNYSPDVFVVLKMMGRPYLIGKTCVNFSNNTILNIKVEDRKYQATFLRHINLNYAGKLSEVTDHIGATFHPGFQNQWLVLFQLRQFTEPFQLKYQVELPSYGAEVSIRKGNGKQQLSRISNMFKYGGQAFYFLDESPEKQKGLNLITDMKAEKVYGITYPSKNTVICVPFHIIQSEKPCGVRIDDKIKPLLKSTCYISYRGNYCTGFLLDETTVISARHVIPFQQQKIGLELGIRFYPYHEQTHGYISRMGQGSVDCLVIKLQNNVISQIKTTSVQQQKTVIFNRQYECLVGNTVLSLGFGKFGYSPSLFRKIQIIMPTIQSGIISKVITLGHKTIFIKTDAALFNGFSGSAIWTMQSIVGMAIFILKNKNDHSNYNRHNFSYTIQFIQHLLDSNHNQQLISEINAELECFDRIQTRHKITLFPKL